MNYTTEFNTWEEVLLSLSEKKVSHVKKRTRYYLYTYERFEPLYKPIMASETTKIQSMKECSFCIYSKE